MKIIVVDDEAAVLENTKCLLTEYGTSLLVTTFTDPLSALKCADNNPFDCALLDIEMLKMSGIELAEQLQKMNSNIQIIFVTAYNTYATEAFECSAIDYVTKPVRKERLFKALDKAVAAFKAFSYREGKTKLKILTFSKLIVMRGNQVVQWQRNKSEEIFAYLLENMNIPVHKDSLCELCWPDYDYKRALVNLQTTIYSIRKSLSPIETDRIRIDYSNNNYRLYLNGISVDFLEFERLLKTAENSRDRISFERALHIYKKGEYLELNGWSWAEPKRIFYQRRILTIQQMMKINQYKS